MSPDSLTSATPPSSSQSIIPFQGNENSSLMRKDGLLMTQGFNWIYFIPSFFIDNPSSYEGNETLQHGQFHLS